MGTVVELLTQLPGNVPSDRLLAGSEEFVEGAREPDNFKPFNDTYGYAPGDKVLRWLGRLLVEHTVVGRAFVGHVDGDDFILILRRGDWKVQCQTILDRFEADASSF